MAGDITRFPDPLAIGYYCWVWNRTDFPNVGDADRNSQAERVRVTSRNVGTKELTVTRGASPIDLNVAGKTYWLVAAMNAQIIEDIDDRIFDLVAGDLKTDKDVDAPSVITDRLDIVAPTPGVGDIRFFEDSANGTNTITLKSPATLTASLSMTLLNALPAGTEFLQISATGVWSTTPATTTVTLDDAYDGVGAGAGRIITADSGPVEVSGADGLQLTAAIPQLLYETTSASEYNFRSACSADLWLLQRGDQDADVSDDTFETGLAFLATSKRFGINTTAPQDVIHALQDTAGSARLRLQTTIDNDLGMVLVNAGVSVWEIGYDTSVNGFVFGRLTFANPVMIIEDTSGQVGIGTITPGSRVEIVTTGDEVGMTINSTSTVNEPTLNLVSEAVVLHNKGEVRLTRRADNPVSSNVGEFWYNDGKDRIELNVGAFAGLTSCPTLNDRADRTIDAGGALNAVQPRGHIRVSANSGVTDNLDTLTAEGPYYDGDIVVLLAATGHTITLRHGVGNIRLDAGANKILVNQNRIILAYDAIGNNWYQISTMQVLT